MQVLACVLSCFSHVRLFVTLWPVAHKAPLYMGFLGKNTGGGCHFLLQGTFPTQGSSPQAPALAGGFFAAEPPRKPSALLGLC